MGRRWRAGDGEEVGRGKEASEQEEEEGEWVAHFNSDLHDLLVAFLNGGTLLVITHW